MILKKKELEPIEDNKSDDNKKLLKYKEIFEELSNERIGEIRNMTFDLNKLTYFFKDRSISPISFIGFKSPINIYKDIYIYIYIYICIYIYIYIYIYI